MIGSVRSRVLALKRFNGFRLNVALKANTHFTQIKTIIQRTRTLNVVTSGHRGPLGLRRGQDHVRLSTETVGSNPTLGMEVQGVLPNV